MRVIILYPNIQRGFKGQHLDLTILKMINFSESLIETLTIKPVAMVIGLNDQMTHTGGRREKEELTSNPDLNFDNQRIPGGIVLLT